MTLTGENDCLPVLTAYSSARTIAASSPPGTVVASFSASDRDVTDAIRYSITCALPTSYNLPFVINSTTGQSETFETESVWLSGNALVPMNVVILHALAGVRGFECWLVSG